MICFDLDVLDDCNMEPEMDLMVMVVVLLVVMVMMVIMPMIVAGGDIVTSPSECCRES